MIEKTWITSRSHWWALGEEDSPAGRRGHSRGPGSRDWL